MYDSSLVELALSKRAVIEPSSTLDLEEFFNWLEQEHYEIIFGSSSYADWLEEYSNYYEIRKSRSDFDVFDTPCIRLKAGSKHEIEEFGFSPKGWYLRSGYEVIPLRDLELQEEIQESDMPLDCLI